ncbi:diguanylate cyclase [Thalassotalea castellviae]|uniref:diguanylate cyclase n=1 Tax=Thalassotalea castellviae TaxID=3075612 RepID=A0ABU2ZZT7_9GAMM|nr:diguanylate cyclase [Thalassotalea sp. W431]MDT0603441.1 diguanylate cyclase [Thalassotalea sp. W431]
MFKNILCLLVVTLIFWGSIAWAQKAELTKIKYCVDPKWAPYEAIHNKKHEGISKEYLDIISQKSPLTFQLVPTTDWHQTLEFVKTNKCHFISMLNQSPERDHFLTFSDVYFHAPNALYAHYDQPMIGNLSSITTQSIAVVLDYRLYHYLKKNFPHINVIAVNNELEGLEKVEAKEIDYYVGSYYSANKIIQDASFSKLRIVGIAELEDKLRIGVNKHSEFLLPHLNQAISKISEQDHQTVFDYFKTTNFVHKTDYTLVLGLACFFSAIFIILYVGYSRSVRFSRALASKNKKLKALHAQLDAKNKQLAELAIRDPLTMLYNRSHLAEMINQQIKLKDRYNKRSCLIMIDIDDFKQINDTLGHKVGDDILKNLSNVLIKCARNSDIVARWGGEEFVLLCPETDIDKAILLAKRFQQALQEMKSEACPNVTCSIGISELHTKDSADEWFISADNAMYQAKAQGKNSISTLGNTNKVST